MAADFAGDIQQEVWGNSVAQEMQSAAAFMLDEQNELAAQLGDSPAQQTTDSNPSVQTNQSAQNGGGGGFFQKLGNWLGGDGWKTDHEIAEEARQKMGNLFMNGEPASTYLKGKTDAQVIALYHRYQKQGAIALSLPPGMSNADFGKLMGWGTGDNAARERIGSLTRDELEKAGVTKEMAKEWRDFYKQVKATNPANPSAQGRAELMQKAYELLGGTD